MFLKFQLLAINVATASLLIFFLCLGSQNLNKRYNVNFMISKTVDLPVGFLIGTSFTFGLITGGLSSILTIEDKN